MIRLAIDMHPPGARPSRVHTVEVRNVGATEASASDPHGERLYEWTCGGERGVVRHRRIDGLPMLITIVMADVAAATRERPRMLEAAER